MTDLETRIQRLDRPNATDTEIAAINRLANQIHVERDPHDPPVPVEQTARAIRTPDPIAEVETWIMWNADGSALLGRADAGIPRMEENRHLAQFDIEVAPQARRKGIGTMLLDRVVAAAASWQRQLLIAGSYGSVPAGEAFLNQFGASRGLEQHVYELELAAVDRELIRRWQERARERASGFELGVWAGRYPEEALEEVAKMMEGFNSVPLGDLEVEDFHFTADLIREMDASLAARGHERWTIFAREKASGTIAGFTEVFWNPGRPTIVDQNLTVVFEPYRNRGLGRWIKAAMIEKILNDRPQAERVRTGNADVNAPMLAINLELGFKVAFSTVIWQVPVERVQAYLNERRIPQSITS